MVQWEYKVLGAVDFSNAAVQSFTKEGEEGWELVACYPVWQGTSGIFKRPVVVEGVESVVSQMEEPTQEKEDANAKTKKHVR